MNRSDILHNAIDIINNDRQSTHGKPEDSFANIANLWSAYLDKTISTQQVAIMMALLKVARTKNNPNHLDNFIDLAGYAALGGELRSDAYSE
jgi:hypothetical protein